jgi:hypothetical protein
MPLRSIGEYSLWIMHEDRTRFAALGLKIRRCCVHRRNIAPRIATPAPAARLVSDRF